jgi:trimeric autotransporter adhesin
VRARANTKVTNIGTVNAANIGMISDRNRKENFASIDTEDVLKGVASIPVRRWNFVGDKKGVVHLGPTAQDFHAAFKVGEDDKHIDVVDANGVMLAAIQELSKELRAQASQLKEQREQIRKLQTDLARRER